MEGTKLGRHEVIKHSAAIHISNTLTHTQRMVSNVLLKNAFNDLLVNDRHQMRVSDLMRSTDCNTRNIKAVKEILSVLATTKLEWNILDKDKKNRWGVSALLAYAEIKNGVCEYEYSSGLRKIFSKPNIYARLNLLIQRQFRGGHTLAIWEYLTEFLCSKGFKAGYTEWISVENFKRLLGVQKNPSYKEFKYVGQRLIKEPIKEINKVSDLHVKVEYRRKSRKVVALRFGVSRKENYQLPLGIEQPPGIKKQEKADTEETDDKPLFERLLSFGLTNSQAKKAIIAHDENYIIEILEIVEKNCRAGRVKNVSAYTMTALKEDYRPQKTFVEEEKNAEKRKAKVYLEAQNRLEIIEKLKTELETERLESVLAKLTELEKKELEAGFIKSVQKRPGGATILKYYKKNGLNSIMVRSLFNVFAREKLLKAPATQRELKVFIKSKGYKIGDFKQELKEGKKLNG